MEGTKQTEQKPESAEGTEPSTPEGLPSDEQTGASEEQGQPRVDSPEEQIATLKDLLLRKAAEFENYKKRTESDATGIIRLANETLVLSILPIVDDLERSLKAGRDIPETSSFYKGVELIHQKVKRILESHGVKPLDTSGKPFDVHYHDAIMQLPRADVPHHTILEEVERGYAMNGKVIRHAKVVVSTTTEEKPEEGSGDEKTGGEGDNE